MNLEARKFIVDSIGNETKLPVKDWVEIGVFAAAKKGEKQGKQLYLKKHFLRSAKLTITVTVPDKPATSGIDPRFLLIDWEMKDNMKEVKIEQ